MSRVLLIVPSASYRTTDFLEAARRLGVEIVVASDRRQLLLSRAPERFVLVDLDDVEIAAASIVAFHREHRLDAVLAVDDGGALTATRASELLGFRHNPLSAVGATRDKAVMRGLLATAHISQPEFSVLCSRSPLAEAEEAARRASEIGFPVVIKPATLAASRGVIRADDPEAARRATHRVRAILDSRTGSPGASILVEQYIDGAEFALEGLLRDGRLAVLALFDKPDPLVGPYFEETIYVTPSRLDNSTQHEIAKLVERACQAIGLVEGPVHGEVRVAPGSSDRRPSIALLETAARTIGGHCAKALRFAAGASLEELVLAHALGIARSTRSLLEASGVMMLPIPRSGRLLGVDGLDAARAVPYVTEVEMTIAVGKSITALPEGNRYLGFLFARAPSPELVEQALRVAHRCLAIRIEDKATSLTSRDVDVSRLLVLSTYELGCQPLTADAAAGLLRAAGHEVRTRDLAVEVWSDGDVDWADGLVCSVPMHTAMRLGLAATTRAKANRVDLPIAWFGLYAPIAGELELVGGRELCGTDEHARPRSLFGPLR